MSRLLSYSSQHQDNQIIPDGTIITVVPEYVPQTDGACGSCGSCGPEETPPTPGDFTTLTAALESLKGKILLGTVTIQVSDGTYTEPSLLFSDPELSGRLIILGNLTNPAACVINVVPDPNYGFKLNPLGGDYYDTIDTQNNQIRFNGAYGLDYSTTSVGITATNGFLLRIGGFTLQGSTSNGINITRSLMIATKGAQIYCPDYSMILNGGLDGVNVGDQSMIFMRFSTIQNCKATSISVSIQGIVSLDGATVTGPGMTYPGFIISDPKTALIYSPSYPIGAAIPCYPLQAESGSLVYADSSSISNYPNGVFAGDSSYVYISGAALSNIADTVGCIRAYMGAAVSADACSFNNVTLPFSGSSAYVSVNNTLSATGIVKGVSASGGTLNASGSNAVFSSVPTPYSPNSNNVATGDTSLLFYS